jgi:hypothetical protein
MIERDKSIAAIIATTCEEIASGQGALETYKQIANRYPDAERFRRYDRSGPFEAFFSDLRTDEADQIDVYSVMEARYALPAAAPCILYRELVDAAGGKHRIYVRQRVDLFEAFAIYNAAASSEAGSVRPSLVECARMTFDRAAANLERATAEANEAKLKADAEKAKKAGTQDLIANFPKSPHAGESGVTVEVTNMPAAKA